MFHLRCFVIITLSICISIYLCISIYPSLSLSLAISLSLFYAFRCWSAVQISRPAVLSLRRCFARNSAKTFETIGHFCNTLFDVHSCHQRKQNMVFSSSSVIIREYLAYIPVPVCSAVSKQNSTIQQAMCLRMFAMMPMWLIIIIIVGPVPHLCFRSQKKKLFSINAYQLERTCSLCAQTHTHTKDNWLYSSY